MTIVKRTMNTDTLQSLLGGLGDESRDKAAGVYYGASYMTDNELINAYRGSWLPRKIVNIPARDSVRAWREWKAEADQIEQIEAEEKRLGLQQKLEQALIKARLFGGAAIFIADGTTDLMRPFEPERVGKGGIKYLTVMARTELIAGELERDPTTEFYQRPAKYMIRGVDIHPSRLIVFNGDEHPEPAYAFGVSIGWGESVLTSMMRSIKNLDSTMANIASLVFEANVDVIGIPELLNSMSDPQYIQNITERLALAQANKGINRSLLMDADETFNRKQTSFAGLPDVADKFMQIVAGACDIPATRLIGMSPAGMSATGESDLKNYYDHVSAEQNLTITPALNRFDEALLRSSLGSRPPEIHHMWSSLWQVSEKEKAENAERMSKVADAYVRTGLFSQPALASAVTNQLVESGVYPGIEQAVEDDPVDWDAELEASAAELALRTEQANNPPETKPSPFAKDAAPRPLYISRKVMNPAPIVAWARKAGLPELMPGSELHVTITYSRTPVDWMKLGEAWQSELKIAAGGPRLVEQFDKGAVVLLFASSELTWRNRAVVEAGGSHDFDEYQPHITVGYSDTPIDVIDIEAYQGEIILGPEIFEPIK